MATSVYKVTEAYRGEPVGSDAFTKFAFALEHVSGNELRFVQTEAATEDGIGIRPDGILLGFVEDEIASATVVLVGVDDAGTQYSATLTLASLATNGTITLETSA